MNTHHITFYNESQIANLLNIVGHTGWNISKLYDSKMSKIIHNRNWNIDAYYDDTEPEEHWQLRKTFMEIHKNKYPEDYLVALSKAFVNIQHLGCV